MAPAGGAKREVAEVGLELLYLELVKACPQRPVLDAMGVQVGHQLAERYTTDRARFADSLEVIKFICKEFWSEVFKKQIDNLKTNRHREIFVLQDNCFRWLRHVAGPSDDTSKAMELASLYLAYPCGMIKGALASLGVQCEVSAEVADITVGACSFHVRIVKETR